MKKNKNRQPLSNTFYILLIVYFIWFAVSVLFQFSNFKPNWFTAHQKLFESLGITAVGLFCIILSFRFIVKSKYEPVTILCSLALVGRIFCYSAQIIFSGNTVLHLKSLPFGGIDSFCFYLICFGIFSIIHKNDKNKQSLPSIFLLLLPIVLFIIPVLQYLLKSGSTNAALYSFLFTAVPAAALFSALRCVKLKSVKLLSAAVIMAVFFDLLTYLSLVKAANSMPAAMPSQLIPFSAIIFTAGIKKRLEKYSD